MKWSEVAQSCDLCMYIYKYVCIYIYVCVYIYVCMCVYIYIYTHIYIWQKPVSNFKFLMGLDNVIMP